MTADPPRPLRYQTDAAFRAAQRVAALGEDLGALAVIPDGETVWREGRDTVRHTPDGWLLYLNGGKAAVYGRRVRATPELLAMLRGQPGGVR